MSGLFDWGLSGMFVAAFFAATILPLGSEVVFGALLHQGTGPLWLVVVATVGNVLGSLLNYVLGIWGGEAVAKRWLKMSDAELASAESRFQRFGMVSLLFAWVPVVGDPITVIAGFLKVPLLWFLALVTVGKLARYCVLAYVLLAAMSN